MPDSTHDAPFTGDDLDTALGRVLNTFEYPSKTQTQLDALSYDADKRIIFYNSTNDYLVYWDGSAWKPFANVAISIGGDTRGAQSIDLQHTRNADTQVASGDYAALVGGKNNTASGDHTLAAGEGNTASGDGAVATGYSTTASGERSLATGHNTTAAGDQAMAAGRDSHARLAGEQAWASGGFSNVAGSAQCSRFVLQRITTSSAPKALLLGGSTPLVLEDDHLYYVRASIVATTTTAESAAAYEVRGMVRRGTGVASVELVGSPVTTTDFESQAGWDATLAADTTNGAVSVQVTGAASATLRWVAFVDWTQIGY